MATPEPELAKLSLNDSNGASKSPNGSGSESGSPNDFKEAFKAFSKFGDTKSDGKHITLSQSDKWMKQAKVIDKKITTTDTGIHFKKLKTLKASYADYNKFLEDLATTKKVELAEIKNKLATCGAPGVLNNSVSDLDGRIIHLFRHIVRFIHSSILFFIVTDWQSLRCGSPYWRHQIHWFA